MINTLKYLFYQQKKNCETSKFDSPAKKKLKTNIYLSGFEHDLSRVIEISQ